MLVGASPFNIVFSFNVCKREYDIFRHMICACVCVRVSACVCLNIDSTQYTVVPMSVISDHSIPFQLVFVHCVFTGIYLYDLYGQVGFRDFFQACFRESANTIYFYR
jgi:hypothetical protein